MSSVYFDLSDETTIISKNRDVILHRLKIKEDLSEDLRKEIEKKIGNRELGWVEKESDVDDADFPLRQECRFVDKEKDFIGVWCDCCCGNTLIEDYGEQLPYYNVKGDITRVVAEGTIELLCDNDGNIVSITAIDGRLYFNDMEDREYRELTFNSEDVVVGCKIPGDSRYYDFEADRALNKWLEKPENIAEVCNAVKKFFE